MIADQKIGKSFMGALDYNMRKLNEVRSGKRAELLASNFSSLDIDIIRDEVKWVRSLRPNLNRYVYHTSLNFLNEELSNLDNDKLLAIAQDYMRAMGFDNNQFIIFRHYDAGHPHIHLLANRIRFDGSVVSDSNNFKRSEAIVRDIESRYNLIPVEQSNYVTLDHSNHVKVGQYNRVTGDQYSGTSLDSNNKVNIGSYDISIEQGNPIPVERGTSISVEQRNHIPVELSNGVSANQGNNVPAERSSSISVERCNEVTAGQPNHITRYQRNPSQRRAPKKNEIEMVLRTGKPSGKMLLQEKLSLILQTPKLSMQDFVQQCALNDIYLLFNQASTGRISGITYFSGSFKAKGQALGNHFKWAEIIKKLDYEQDRDGQAISQANGRTREHYGDFTKAEGGYTPARSRKANVESVSGERDHPADGRGYETATGAAGGTADQNRRKAAPDLDVNPVYGSGSGDRSNYTDHDLEITIGDDIDDEAILGRNRRRQQQARQNTR
jgi:hypothetical protein